MTDDLGIPLGDRPTAATPLATSSAHLTITGPFAAIDAEQKAALSSGFRDKYPDDLVPAPGQPAYWFEYGRDDPDTLVPTSQVLRSLVGIGIFCTSNRCTQRVLTHHHEPPLVGVLVTIQFEGDAAFQRLIVPPPGRTSRRRRPIGGQAEKNELDLPADITCHRCNAKGTVAITPLL